MAWLPFQKALNINLTNKDGMGQKKNFYYRVLKFAGQDFLIDILPHKSKRLASVLNIHNIVMPSFILLIGAQVFT